MTMNKIITIGREFGSGGRELGRRLSEALGIAYYGKEIISEISRHTALSEQYIQTIVKRTPIRPFPIHIGRSFYAPVNPPFQQHLNIFRACLKIGDVSSREGFWAAGKQFFRRNPGGLQGKIAPSRGQKTR